MAISERSLPHVKTVHNALNQIQLRNAHNKHPEKIGFKMPRQGEMVVETDKWQPIAKVVKEEVQNPEDKVQN